MGILMRIMGCVACLFVAYMATMAWVNVNEGKDAFAGTPFEGKVDSEFAKKAVDFTSEQIEKLKAESKPEPKAESKVETKVESKEVSEAQNLREQSVQVKESENPPLVLAEKEQEPKQVQEAKPTTEDALERLWGVDDKKSNSAKSTNNTATRTDNADASLMNSLERLMN